MNCPSYFTALGIFAVARQCPYISGHIKTVIGIFARRRLVFASFNCEYSGRISDVIKVEKRLSDLPIPARLSVSIMRVA